MNFHHSLPVEIYFGFDTRRQLKDIAGGIGTRGFLIVDPVIECSEVFEEFIADAGSLFAGRWSEVEPNPSVESVMSAARELANAEADYIVAIGGGSAIDTAKAVALVAATGVDVREYHTGGKAVGDQSLPIIAMPTTAGTGSEVTFVSVLTDKTRGVKAPIGGMTLLPKVAIVDPQWTMSLPPAVTASGGLDALSHAFEAYWSTGAQPVCDAFAEKAAGLILGSLEKAFNDGNDRDSREQMALGSLLAGLAFGLPKTAGVHACSFPLTQRFGLSHGVACALTLDAFLLYNAQDEEMGKKLGCLAEILNFDSVKKMAEYIKNLKSRMGLPMSLSQAGIPADQLEVLITESFHPNMKNNPREVTPDDLKKLYMSLEG